jgi:pimeloyl-ACP methyl ester carboxylesterase
MPLRLPSLGGTKDNYCRPGNIAMQRIGLFVCGTALALLAGGNARADQALAIAKQGYFFVGGKIATVNDRQVMSGQAYVEFQIPRRQSHPYPVVIIPGAAQTATNFTGTPDGREGWAEFFLSRGYAVYIMEQPGRGRSGYQPDLDGPQVYPNVKNVEDRFTAPERAVLWPQAKLHTQWPGTGLPGDPVFNQFFASQVPFLQKPELIQTLNRDAAVAILDRIGPAIVMTHSQSGAFGWPIAEARPNLVKALVEVEPSGPPVHDLDLIGAPDYFRDGALKPWGLTAIPLNYAPSVSNPAELTFVRQDQPDGPDLARCWLQTEPARQLPSLQKTPIVIVTGESSFHAPFEHCTVKYLEQAGVHPTWLQLGKLGIHGNGHMMMLEKNNLQIAEVIVNWLNKSVSAKSASGHLSRIGAAD